MGERQSSLAGLQVYLHPASRRFGRGGAAFRAGSHTSTWLSVGLRFLGSKLHVCEKEEKPQLTPPRQHTSGSHSNRTPCLAVWLPSLFTVRAGGSGHLESVILTGYLRQCQSGWAPGRGRASWLWPWKKKQVSPGVQISSRSSKMISEMARKKKPPFLLHFQLPWSKESPQLAIEGVYFLGD